MKINPVSTGREVQTQAFQGKHLHRNFSAMMDYIYKGLPCDVFEAEDVMRVSAQLDDGREVSGTAYFLYGKFQHLVLDEGFEGLKQKFMKTALERYNKRIASKKVQQKLGYDKL